MAESKRKSLTRILSTPGGKAEVVKGVKEGLKEIAKASAGISLAENITKAQKVKKQAREDVKEGKKLISQATREKTTALSEKDMDRIDSLKPNMFDSKEVRKEKLKKLRVLLRKNNS
jgi:putative ubiquitin-RnfH superfamily antitoxin RatB of RatAB toxin-antitoxin module